MHRTEHHALGQIVQDEEACVYVWLIVFDAVGHEWDEARLPSAVLPGYCRLKQCSPFINWGKEHTGEQVLQFKAPMKSDDDFLLCV
jgi:hypothetical protein